MAIQLTEKASEELKSLLQKEKESGNLKEGAALRLMVVGGGCSGFTYKMGFDENVQETDRVIEITEDKVIDHQHGYTEVLRRRTEELDLVVGAVTSFNVDVFRGNFEHGASRILTDVAAEIEEVLVARNITDEEGNDEGQFFVVGNSEPWLLNVITPSRNRQEILRARFVDTDACLSREHAE